MPFRKCTKGFPAVAKWLILRAPLPLCLQVGQLARMAQGRQDLMDKDLRGELEEFGTRFSKWLRQTRTDEQKQSGMTACGLRWDRLQFATIERDFPAA